MHDVIDDVVGVITKFMYKMGHWLRKFSKSLWYTSITRRSNLIIVYISICNILLFYICNDHRVIHIYHKNLWKFSMRSCDYIWQTFLRNTKKSCKILYWFKWFFILRPSLIYKVFVHLHHYIRPRGVKFSFCFTNFVFFFNNAFWSSNATTPKLMISELSIVFKW